MSNSRKPKPTTARLFAFHASANRPPSLDEAAALYRTMIETTSQAPSLLMVWLDQPAMIDTGRFGDEPMAVLQMIAGGVRRGDVTSPPWAIHLCEGVGTASAQPLSPRQQREVDPSQTFDALMIHTAQRGQRSRMMMQLFARAEGSVAWQEPVTDETEGAEPLGGPLVDALRLIVSGGPEAN